ncbi:DUF5374 domain-containing protein [Bisgaard Taxon 45]
MIFYHYKGTSLSALLIALMLFCGIFLSTHQWLTYQRQHAIRIYQRIQALQIAQNQKQRQFLGLACESQVKQNGLTFQVQCTPHSVHVTASFVEIIL